MATPRANAQDSFGPAAPLSSERILRSLPGDVQILDLDGRLVLLAGRSVEHAGGLIGRSIEEWCRARGLPVVVANQRRAALDRALARGTTEVDQERRPGPLGGERRWIRATAPLLDGDGEPSGVITLSLDLPREPGGPPAEVAVGDFAEAEKRALRAALAEVRERLARISAENQALLSFGVLGEPGPAIYRELPGLSDVRSAIAAHNLRQGPLLVAGEVGTGTRAVGRLALSAGEPSRTWSEIDCVDEPDRARRELERMSAAQVADGGAGQPAWTERWLLHEVCGLDSDSQATLAGLLQRSFPTEQGRADSTDGVGHAPGPRSATLHIVATTNRDVAAEVAKGRFRADLRDSFARRTVHVPALRHRSEDIEILAGRLLERTSQRQGIGVEAFSPDQVSELRTYLWPGNIDELRTVVERAVLSARDRHPRLLLPDAPDGGAPSVPGVQAPGGLRVLTDAEMRQRERENLVAALSRTEWKIYGESGAAALLGLRPTTLASRIKKLNIVRHGDRR